MTSATLTRPLPLGRRVASALISGFAVAATTHVATLLVYFATNGAVTDNIVPISGYFLPSSLALFVLYSVAAFLGSNRFRLVALAAGLVSGVVAALVGTTLGVVTSGTALTSETLGFIVASLVGTSLVLLVAAGIAAATSGRWAWSIVTSAARRPIAIIRRPSSRLAEGQVTHIDRTPVDEELADAQWEAYVGALEAAGFTAVEVPVADDLPDSAFVEDALVVFGGTAVVTSPGAESRRAETDAVLPVAKKLGFKTRDIALPGTLDGGDVLKVGSTVYVGRGGRTNSEGISQLREIVAPLGYTVVAVPVKKALHLKSTVSALPDGTVVGYSKLVDNPQLFDRFLALPEPGAGVVVLSTDTVLMAASAPKSIALIEDLGYRVVAVDVSEFEKLEGCVTCLSVRVR